MTESVFTTSWDDGYPADRRLAEHLTRHRIDATFYIPTQNREGRAVMGTADIAALGKGFEIGGHTADHMVLPGQPADVALRKIRDNKEFLEDTLGRTVPGFCYPRGEYDATTKLLVKRAGYAYARTVRTFRSDKTADPFEVPTTIQFYPHARDVYVRNMLRKPGSVGLFLTALGSTSLVTRVCRLIDQIAQSGGIAHLWGHSWEIENLDLWDDLDTIFEYAAATFSTARCVTNGETVWPAFV
jgi:peptidoglycan/xylan/chitin deacetylase (PgdA/CDA1 family)